MSMQTLVIFAIVSALGLFAGVTAPYIVDILMPAADAQEGVPFEKNFGQCKQDKNRNACENVVK
jgi:hypothetical protein